MCADAAARERGERIAVLGVGNLLMRDDGVGIHVVRALERAGLPDAVQIIDGGTAAFEALCHVQPLDRLIVVDAVQYGGAPGSIYRLTPDQIEERPATAVSLHDIGVLESLRMSEPSHVCPESVVIFGVEPEAIDWGLELSEPVQAVIPKVVRGVVDELSERADRGVSTCSSRK